MLQNQKDNIKALVQSSPLLNDTEREEWLSLMEVMDDKQILELQKILDPNSSNEGVAANNSFLSHIVNMPQPTNASTSGKIELKIENAKSGSLSQRTVDDGKTAINQQANKKEFGSFAENLHNIMSEKDLPPGEDTGHLNIPGKDGQIQTSPVVAGFVKQPEPSAIPLTQKSKPVALSDSARVKPVSINLSEISKDFTQPASSVQAAPEPPRVGLQNQDALVKAQIYRQQAEALHRRTAIAGSTPSPASVKPVTPDLSPLKKPVVADVKISSLQDVSSLSPRIWKPANYSGVVKRLKDLIHSYNYHDVIFNLESSLLYKSYISTGVEVLKNGTNFEDLGANASSLEEVYLSHEDFEAFTDLLREIQAN